MSKSKGTEENTDTYPMINEDTVDTFQSNQSPHDRAGTKAEHDYWDYGPGAKDPGNPGYRKV